MRTYCVSVTVITLWEGDVIKQYFIDLSNSETETADLKTFKEKLNLKYLHNIIAWSLIEE